MGWQNLPWVYLVWYAVSRTVWLIDISQQDASKFGDKRGFFFPWTIPSQALKVKKG